MSAAPTRRGNTFKVNLSSFTKMPGSDALDELDVEAQLAALEEEEGGANDEGVEAQPGQAADVGI
jgi:hypothetical protein